PAPVGGVRAVRPQVRDSAREEAGQSDLINSHKEARKVTKRRRRGRFWSAVIAAPLWPFLLRERRRRKGKYQSGAAITALQIALLVPSRAFLWPLLPHRYPARNDNEGPTMSDTNT